MLAQFRISFVDIKIAILELNEDILDAETVEKMVPACPTGEEFMQVKNYEGDLKLLGKAEQCVLYSKLLDFPLRQTYRQCTAAQWSLVHASIYAHLVTTLCVYAVLHCRYFREVGQIARLQTRLQTFHYKLVYEDKVQEVNDGTLRPLVLSVMFHPPSPFATAGYLQLRPVLILPEAEGQPWLICDTNAALAAALPLSFQAL